MGAADDGEGPVPTPSGHAAYPYPGAAVNPQADSALALSITTLVLCQLLAPFAWVKAHRLLRAIDASPNTIVNRGTVVAAQVIAVAGTGLLALLVLLVCTR